MELYEWILLPIYLLVIYILAFYFRDKVYKNDPTRKYFIWGLSAKLFGAIFYALIYIFYYQGFGDTFAYYSSIQEVLNTYHQDPLMPFQIIHDISRFQESNRAFNFMYFSMEETYTVVRLGVPLAMLSCNSFIITTMLFGLVSFTGSWALFRTLVRIYPRYPLQMAISALFIPSVVFFGSPLLKDTVMIFAVGWMFYSVYHLFILRRKILFSLVMIAYCTWLIVSIKVYILLGLGPAIFYWILTEIPKGFKDKSLRIIMSGASVLVFLGVIFIGNMLINSLFEQYNFTKILGKLKAMQKYHLSLGVEETSAYDLGDYEASFTGLLKKAPAAINVTFYRPYAWEIKNALMIIAFLESTLFILLTLYVIIRAGWRFPLILFSDNFLVFCLIFSLVFGFFVGFASFNFGALMRYKIPCLPFFMAMLLVIDQKNKDWKKGVR